MGRHVHVRLCLGCREYLTIGLWVMAIVVVAALCESVMVESRWWPVDRSVAS